MDSNRSLKTAVAGLLAAAIALGLCLLFVLAYR